MRAFPVVCGRHFGRFHQTPLITDEVFATTDDAVRRFRSMFPTKLVAVIDETGGEIWRLFPIIHNGD